MLNVGEEIWDLTHLDPFGFQFELESRFIVSVIVFFSCHCFMHDFSRTERLKSSIPKNEIYDYGREQRMLCRTLYDMSKRFLRDLILTLPMRRIILADDRQTNFVIFEMTDESGAPSTYTVFFEVVKSRARKYCLILQVQSAYILEMAFRSGSNRQRRSRSVDLARSHGRPKNLPVAHKDKQLP